MIRLEQISKKYDGRNILAGIDLAVEKGKCLGLVGPSGGGKTTLLRITAGLEEAESGKVVINGVTATEDKKIKVPPRKRSMGFVFQDLGLWPHMTAGKHLEFQMGGKSKPSRKERAEIIEKQLDRVSISHKINACPGELSGGERQRLAIARALVDEPDILLFDEPFSDLDHLLKGEMLTLVKTIRENTGATVIYVTHNIREALELTGELAVLHRGVLVQSGDYNEMKEKPADDFVKRFLTVKP